jgi:phosphoribosyl 1,2-cyclic phosphate phosphodiesterase
VSGGVLRFTVLGCGSSGGVPRIGGDWGSCDPTNPKNRRSRCSLLIERKRADDPWSPENTTTVLVDTSPDLREQMLRAEVKRLDAVLLTHDHADQTHGVDDLRVFWLMSRRRVPIHMSEETAAVMLRRFDYVFTQPAGSLYPAVADAHVDLAPGSVTVVAGPGGPIEARALDQDHGSMRTLGFRFGPAAYSNDVVDLPEESFAELQGLDLWIVDALQDAPHLTHAHVEKTLGWIARLAPRRAVLTNLHVTLDYAQLDARTPAHVSPAHDGLRIEIEE